MSINIKLRSTGRHAKPVTKAEITDNVLYLTVSALLAFFFVPYLVDRGSISEGNGWILAIFFAILSGFHLVDLVGSVRQLREQGKAAV